MKNSSDPLAFDKNFHFPERIGYTYLGGGAFGKVYSIQITQEQDIARLLGTSPPEMKKAKEIWKELQEKQLNHLVVKIMSGEAEREKEITEHLYQQTSKHLSTDYTSARIIASYMDPANDKNRSDDHRGAILLMPSGDDIQDLNQTLETKLSLEDKKSLCRDLVDSVRLLHEADVAHVDLKPGNLLVNKAIKTNTANPKNFDTLPQSRQAAYTNKRPAHLKICDFGISVLASDAENPEFQPAGTVDYLSIERFKKCMEKKGTQAPDTFETFKKHDSWSVAILLCAILTEETNHQENLGIDKAQYKELFMELRLDNINKIYYKIQRKIQAEAAKLPEDHPAKPYLRHCGKMQKDQRLTVGEVYNEFDTEKDTREVATIRIQKHARGYKVRKGKREVATIRIQKHARGYKVRKGKIALSKKSGLERGVSAFGWVILFLSALGAAGAGLIGLNVIASPLISAPAALGLILPLAIGGLTVFIMSKVIEKHCSSKRLGGANLKPQPVSSNKVKNTDKRKSVPPLNQPLLESNKPSPKGMQ